MKKRKFMVELMKDIVAASIPVIAARIVKEFTGREYQDHIPRHGP